MYQFNMTHYMIEYVRVNMSVKHNMFFFFSDFNNFVNSATLMSLAFFFGANILWATSVFTAAV